METFYQFLDYIQNIIQEVIYIILDNWLLTVLFGIQIMYLIVNAVKLKRNTD